MVSHSTCGSIVELCYSYYHNWDSNNSEYSHISIITKKANSTLGFLRRNIHRCPINSKQTAYIALLRAVLEYAAIVWDPYHRADINKLEKIQHRAARFITGDYRSRHPGSVTTLLTDLNLDTLDNRRRDQRLTELLEDLSQPSPLKHSSGPKKQTKHTLSLSTSQTMYPQIFSNN